MSSPAETPTVPKSKRWSKDADLTGQQNYHPVMFRTVLIPGLKNKKPQQNHMETKFIHFKNFNYAFRPDSYFEPDTNPLHWLLSKVTGVQRRKLIEDAFRKGKVIPPEILEGTISDELRSWISSIHPSFMGGEYLPEVEENQVEIARIILNSTTTDVISVRARFEDGYYYYSVVDEYQEEFLVPVDKSGKPFTFKEFIRFLNGVRLSNQDAVGIVTLYAEININSGSSYEEMVDFQKVDSDFYPELSAYYRKYIPEYLKCLK
jgi:hypothetical protein